jgi:hypothetical protein
MNAFHFFLGPILLLTAVPAVWLGLFLLACRCIRVEYGTAISNNSSVLEITRRSGGYFRIYALGALVWDESIVQVSMETQFLRFIRDLSRIVLNLRNALVGLVGLSIINDPAGSKAIEDNGKTNHLIGIPNVGRRKTG